MFQMILHEGGEWTKRLFVLQMMVERDKSLRAAALAFVEALYVSEGPTTLWSAFGKLSDQQKSLIQERLKYLEKGAARLEIPGLGQIRFFNCNRRSLTLNACLVFNRVVSICATGARSFSSCYRRMFQLF